MGNSFSSGSNLHQMSGGAPVLRHNPPYLIIHMEGVSLSPEVTFLPKMVSNIQFDSINSVMFSPSLSMDTEHCLYIMDLCQALLFYLHKNGQCSLRIPSCFFSAVPNKKIWAYRCACRSARTVDASTGSCRGINWFLHLGAIAVMQLSLPNNFLFLCPSQMGNIGLFQQSPKKDQSQKEFEPEAAGWVATFMSGSIPRPVCQGKNSKKEEVSF